MDRRVLIKLLSAAALSGPGSGFASHAEKLTADDEALLDDLERRGCLFFAEQMRRRLRFHCDVLPNDQVFFCHFNDIETGQPWHNSEISSIDTALLLCGVLTAHPC